MEISILVFLPGPERLCFRRCLSVCLSVCLLATLQKLANGFARNFQANEQTIKFCGRSGSPPGIVFRMRHYREIRKVGRTINRLCCAMRQCRASTSRHRHSNYNVITSPAHDRRPLAEVCTVSVLLVLIRGLTT